MKINVKICQNSHRKWCKNGTVYVSGAAFAGSEALLRDVDVAQQIVRFDDTESVCKFISAMNGFFAVVAQGNTWLIAAVDRIRSIPLFYAYIDSQLYLSNDVEWVRTQVGTEDMDPIAEQEFLLAGYVTGADTLFPNVKQLQAGEWLQIYAENGVPQVRVESYYHFNHSELSGEYDELIMRSELDEIVKATVRRLIAYADGRLIVVPLSAGHDSRLIAFMLKRCGYNKVLCFSYGVAGNFEAEVSKRVAQELGFRWVFVEYSNELWRSWWQSSARREYYRMASGWVSLPHIQDWPAVFELECRCEIEPAAVFVPGHSGDFIAGSHIPKEARPKRRASLASLYETIFWKHYALANWSYEMIRNMEFWRARCKDRAGVDGINTGIELADAFEKWDWQERQAKFIVNSVRVYEFWGYDWWLPLWDAELMAFWQRMPLRLRLGREFYRMYVDWIWNADGLTVMPTNLREQRTVRLIKDALKVVLPRKIVNRINRYRTISRQYKELHQHFLAWFCQYDEVTLRNFIKAGYSYAGISAYQFLQEAGSVDRCDSEALDLG